MLYFFRRSFFIALKNIKQISRQKGALVITMLAPILTLCALNSVFKADTTSFRIATVSQPSTFLNSPPTSPVAYRTTSFDKLDSMLHSLKSGEFMVGIDFSGDKPAIYLGSTLYATNAASYTAASKALSIWLNNQINTKSSLQESINIQEQIDVNYIYDISSFSIIETMGPGLFGALVMFSVFVISGISFLREKISGTLERTLISPVRLSEVILGFGLSFGLVSIVQTTVLHFFYHYALGLHSNGNFIAILSISLATVLCALTFGMLISAFANTEFQVMQIVPIFFAPQMALSGLFDLSRSHGLLKIISRCLPMTYSVEGFASVMLKGYSTVDIKDSLTALFCFSSVFLLLTYFSLSRYKPKFIKIS